MSTSSRVRPPAVVWSDDAPPEVEEALVFPPRVQQLVNQLWHRLPEEARAIIACHLRHVTLVPHGSEGISCGHGAEEILVYLPDEAIHIEPEFEHWKPGIAWVVGWGFGQAFLWSLLTRIVGVNPEEPSFADASQEVPGRVLTTSNRKPPLRCGTQGIASQTGPTSTVLGNSRRSISDAMGVRVTRGMASVFLAFKRRMQDRSFTPVGNEAGSPVAWGR